MKKLLAIALIILSPAIYAQRISTPTSAIFLYSACSEYETNRNAAGFCDGVIEASYSVMDNWCVPSDVSHREVKRHVRAQLVLPMPRLGQTAFDFIQAAISQKWPCQR